MTYNKNDIIRIAKRENNTMRSYLVLNRLQAKHIQADPVETIEMFDTLAEKLSGKIDPATTLIIGFAETATAIGAHLAVYHGTYYIQTTREDIKGAKYIYFSEMHSHASEQRIVRNELDKVIDGITDIVFAEDELTTGNTILNAIHSINKAYKKRNFRFHAVSLINGMDKKSLNLFARKGVTIRFLIKTNNEEYEETAAAYESSGRVVPAAHTNTIVNTVTAQGMINPRMMTTGKKYASAMKALYSFLKSLKKKTTKNVLFIGTEECMYPAIYIANRESKGVSRVRTHSTTRSPIAVCTDEAYPLHTRFELHSLYDSERQTYIYDLDSYDHVVIVTDAPEGDETGLNELVAALESVGNENIELVRWIP